MSHEIPPKQNTKEKIVTPETQNIENYVDDNEILDYKIKKEKEKLQRRVSELNEAEELRDELTKKEEVIETPVVKEEKGKISRFFRKAALALGLTGALVGKMEANTEQNISDKKQIDIEQTTSISQESGKNNISWDEARNNLKQEINSPITQESTKVIIPEFKHINKAEEEYFNPSTEKGVSSGNMMYDFLYKNPWLYKVPGVKNLIKNKAREIAIKTKGYPVVHDVSTMEEKLKEEKVDRPGFEKYVDTFFYGEKAAQEHGFKKTSYKPTSDYLEFLPTYDIKGDIETNPNINSIVSHWINMELLGKTINSKEQITEKNRQEIIDSYNNFLKTKEPIFNIRDKDGSDIARALNANLARHKTGMAWDKDLDLPYVSISDAWDFEPNSYSDRYNYVTSQAGVNDYYDYKKERESTRQKALVQSTLMQRTGHPYKIYSQFFFNPKTREYISDEEISKMREKLGITLESQNAQKVADNTASYFNLPPKRVFQEKAYTNSVNEIIKNTTKNNKVNLKKR